MTETYPKVLLRAGLCLFATLLLGAPRATAEPRSSFNLPAGDAAEALSAFSVQSGREIVFSPAAVRGARTGEVRGEFAAPDALALLLAGTGLTATMDPVSGAIAIRRQTRPETSPKSAGRASAPAETTREPVLTLSPFTVSPENEQGYVATQTLNGTRLKSELRDVGVAVSIFTDQLLDDLAAVSVTDLVSYAPNTDPYVGNTTDTTGAGNEFLTGQVPQFVTRGGSTGLINQDFFSSPSVPPDRYNSENLTFTRGPNSILFGLGNAAGGFSSTLKRARFRDRASLELRGGDEGSLRGTVDVNRVLVAQRFALRYAGLREVARGFREPSKDEQQRHFVALQIEPLRQTAFRIAGEIGTLRTTALRPWPVYDALTPWLEAGSPLVNRGDALRDGIENAFGATQNLVMTNHSPAGEQVPILHWQNQRRSGLPSYPRQANLNRKRSLVRPDLFPVMSNVHGVGSFRDLSFKALTVAWEQQLNRDFAFEASVNRVVSDTLISAALNGLTEYLYADPNRQLPNGAPNPNVGLPYVESFLGVLPNRLAKNTGRLMVSYELDATRAAWAPLRMLGRHRVAAMGETVSSGTWSSNHRSMNLTPLPGDPGSIMDPVNTLVFRHYLDPSRGAVGVGIDGLRYPVVFAGDSLPPRSPGGVTVGMVPAIGGTAIKSVLRTQLIATQSRFWRDRLIVTFGFRDDRQATYRGTQSDFAPFVDGRGIFPDPRRFDAGLWFPRSRQDVSGSTHTRGAVFHATPWLSFSYNTANSLQPNSSIRDVWGKLLPPVEGEGQDYGAKFSLAGGRLVADLVYYRNFSRNRPDASVIRGTHGDFAAMYEIWATVAALEKDPKYLQEPYSVSGSIWQDTNTGTSDGVEATITANPSPQWRVMFNASRRGPGRTVSRGLIVNGYIRHFLPVWRGNARWMQTTLISGGGTIADAVAETERVLANFNALAALPSDSLLSPAWSSNLIVSYSFPGQTWLKGISLGASANVRGKTIIGFAEDSNRVLQANRPYRAREFQTVGTWASYRRKIWNGRIDWRVQLNVRNVLDENQVFPNRMVDRRDTSGSGEVVIYRLNAPRSFVLTSTFTF